MSNADDRCVFVDSDGQCKYLRGNHWYVDGWHAFVESAPQPAPSGEYAFCKFIDGKMVECDGYGNEPGWRERSQHGESVPIPPGSTFRLTEAQYAQLIANHQPAPSGDEAKVREIADDIYRRLWKGDHDPLVQHTLLPAAVAAGRTLGREDASKECEGIAVEEMCGSKRTLSERLTGKRIVEAIIARRGSEGK